MLCFAMENERRRMGKGQTCGEHKELMKKCPEDLQEKKNKEYENWVHDSICNLKKLSALTTLNK